MQRIELIRTDLEIRENPFDPFNPCAELKFRTRIQRIELIGTELEFRSKSVMFIQPPDYHPGPGMPRDIQTLYPIRTLKKSSANRRMAMNAFIVDTVIRILRDVFFVAKS